MEAVIQLHEEHRVSVSQACETIGLSRASYYRDLKGDVQPQTPRPSPPRALSTQERQSLLDMLNSERFCDQAPRQVYAALLETGVYLAHWRTMYRVLEHEDQVRERRQAARRSIPAPRLIAMAPCQVWSWDITKLRGPKHVYYYLYVIIDIFSRYVVGWTLARMECKHIAHDFIEATCQKQGITPGQLTLHADRGASMRSSTVGELMKRLGVESSYNRPRVSNDNPFSESAFKTLKYSPQFPEYFASQGMAWDFCSSFFEHYNTRHYHSGLALLTPAVVHSGRVEQAIAQRDEVLAQAFLAHPQRFPHGQPKAARLPKVVAINPLPASEIPDEQVEQDTKSETAVEPALNAQGPTADTVSSPKSALGLRPRSALSSGSASPPYLHSPTTQQQTTPGLLNAINPRGVGGQSPPSHSLLCDNHGQENEQNNKAH